MSSTIKPATKRERDTDPSELLPEPKLDGELYKNEKVWSQRYDFLLKQGYKLRPRYHPGWKASWKGVTPSDKDEDSISMSFVGNIMDAERTSDRAVVMMKVVPKGSMELRITQMLASTELQQDLRNHSVPLLDIQDDSLDETKCIMFLPLLRGVAEPPFSSIGDCIDFIEQTLEGIAFLHEHEIAHRDCFEGNIMMDARALYPKGWHPQDTDRYPSGRFMNTRPKRKGIGGVRYYFIDYGISSLSQAQVTGDLGQKRAPELSDTIPYDPYKVDIWLLGSCYDFFITEKYQGTSWITELTNAMTRTDPAARPTVGECIAQFQEIKSKISSFQRASRLHPIKQEGKVVELTRDAAYLISEAFWALKPRSKPLKPFQASEKKVETTQAESSMPADEPEAVVSPSLIGTIEAPLSNKG